MGAVVPFPMCRTPAQSRSVRARSALASPSSDRSSRQLWGEVIILPVVQLVRHADAPTPPDSPTRERREPL